MDHFAGLDVSVKETSVCILDDAGKIVKEVKVARLYIVNAAVLAYSFVKLAGVVWAQGSLRLSVQGR
jgi:hypothetical protein